jgi:hypothetical protein
MKDILNTIVQHSQIHARWLNTLSLMENTGAKKINVVNIQPLQQK